MTDEPRDPDEVTAPAGSGPHPDPLQAGAGAERAASEEAREPTPRKPGAARPSSSTTGDGGPKTARVPAKALRAKPPAGPLGEDEALITDGEEAKAAPVRAGATTRPERKGEREGPPPKVRHEPESSLELSLAAALTAFSVEFRAPVLGDPVIVVPADRLVPVARILKDDPHFACDYPRCISGVDLIESLELVYHLYSVPRRHQIWLKVRVSPERPSVPSVTPVWRGAEWHEREAAELFGFDFPGHPCLKMPFLLDDGFEGHPLLKSFELEPEISNVFPG